MERGAADYRSFKGNRCERMVFIEGEVSVLLDLESNLNTVTIGSLLKMHGL